MPAVDGSPHRTNPLPSTEWGKSSQIKTHRPIEPDVGPERPLATQVQSLMSLIRDLESYRSFAARWTFLKFGKSWSATRPPAALQDLIPALISSNLPDMRSGIGALQPITTKR